MLEEHYPEISKALEGIAMVEMRHYKILSHLMLELDVDDLSLDFDDISNIDSSIDDFGSDQ